MARSLNKVQLIGNLTRDPELKYTSKGTAVCTFTVATNREWQTDGEKQEQAEFTRCVAWQKLGEICEKYLSKGKKVFVEGRLQTRKWTGQDNVDRYTTEVVLSEMIILDSRGDGESNYSDSGIDNDEINEALMAEEGAGNPGSSSNSRSGGVTKSTNDSKSNSKSKSKTSRTSDDTSQDDGDEDIPF